MCIRDSRNICRAGTTQLGMPAENACRGSRRGCKKIFEDCFSIDEYDPLLVCECHQQTNVHSSKDGRIKRETGEAYTAAIVRPCRVLRAEGNMGKRKVCDDLVLIRKTEYTTTNRIATLEDSTCTGVAKLCEALST